MCQTKIKTSLFHHILTLINELTNHLKHIAYRLCVKPLLIKNLLFKD